MMLQPYSVEFVGQSVKNLSSHSVHRSSALTGRMLQYLWREKHSQCFIRWRVLVLDLKHWLFLFSQMLLLDLLSVSSIFLFLFQILSLSSRLKKHYVPHYVTTQAIRVLKLRIELNHHTTATIFLQDFENPGACCFLDWMLFQIANIKLILAFYLFDVCASHSLSPIAFTQAPSSNTFSQSPMLLHPLACKHMSKI